MAYFQVHSQITLQGDAKVGKEDPPVLTVDEKVALETYTIDMAQYGHPLSTE